MEIYLDESIPDHEDLSARKIPRLDGPGMQPYPFNFEPRFGLREKLTKGKQKIPIEFIHDRARRYSTFSKRKTGMMKKAVELAELTGAEVLLLIASETNHVYTYATKRLRSIIEMDCGKELIKTCLSTNCPTDPSESTEVNVEKDADNAPTTPSSQPCDEEPVFLTDPTTAVQLCSTHSEGDPNNSIHECMPTVLASVTSADTQSPTQLSPPSVEPLVCQENTAPTIAEHPAMVRSTLNRPTRLSESNSLILPGLPALTGSPNPDPVSSLISSCIDSIQQQVLIVPQLSIPRTATIVFSPSSVLTTNPILGHITSVPTFPVSEACTEFAEQSVSTSANSTYLQSPAIISAPAVRTLLPRRK